LANVCTCAPKKNTPTTNTRGEWVVPPKYTTVREFHEGRAVVSLVIKARYDLCRDFDSDHCLATGGWKGASTDAACDRNTSVLNHAAVVALLRTHACDGNLQARLEASLASSWVHLTGKFRRDADMHDPLPARKVLARVDPLVQAFAAAVFKVMPDGKPLSKELLTALRGYNNDPAKREVRENSLNGLAALAGPAAYLGLALPAMLFPLASKTLHPYLHLTEAQVREKAPVPLRWLLESELGKFITRHHFVHHARKDEDVNFNLLPGGDFVRGVARAPNAEELAEMKRLKMLV